MGLLDQMLGNPSDQGLYALASGLLGVRRGNEGRAFMGAMDAYNQAQQEQRRNKLTDAQLEHIKAQTELNAQTLKKAQEQFDLQQKILRNVFPQMYGGMPQATPSGIPSAPPVGPMNPEMSPVAAAMRGNAFGATQAQAAPSGPSGLSSLTPDQIAGLKLGGVGDLTDIYKYATSPQKQEPGTYARQGPTGEFRYVPKPEVTPQGMGVVTSQGADGKLRLDVLPGAPEAVVAAELAKLAATKPYEIITWKGKDGGERQGTYAQRLAELTGNPNPFQPQTAFPRVTPQQQGAADAERRKVLQNEASTAQDPAMRATAQAELDRMGGGGQSAGAGVPAGTSPMQDKFDAKMATDLVDWAANGAADAAHQAGVLKSIAPRLTKDSNLTGGWVGMTPRKVLPYTNKQAADVLNDIESVVQRGLRPILGAQFTENEGVRLIERTYNPALPPEMNRKRLEALAKQMQISLEIKNDALAYFRAHGTMAGWDKKMPSWEDFYNAVDSAGATGGAIGQSSGVLRFDANGNPKK